MLTTALSSIVLVAIAGLLFLLVTRRWKLEDAFIRISWIPLAALLLEGIFFEKLTSAFGYFSIGIVVLTCIASLFLSVMGGTLVVLARQREERYSGLLRATLIASVPGILLAGYIIYSILFYALQGGA